ncbi:hypothetical protein AZZ74_002090, partial [Klebsiella pneumoniae]
MPFYLTRDPVPSADMRNVFDNAQNLDLALNDLTSSLWTDRLGRSRMSWFGLESAFSVKLSDFESRFTSQIVEQEATFDASQADKENRFQHFLVSSGYVFLGDYEDGPFQFSARNQYIRYDNQYYRLNAATDVGFTTTGTDATSFANDVSHFVLMDGDTLRQNLGSEEPGFGTFMIMHKKRFRNPTNMAKIIDGRDGFNFTEVLPDNYLEYISPYLTAAETIDAIGDLYEFVAEADEYARLKGKSVWLPCGNTPVSQPYIQNARSLRGIPGHSFLAAHTNFPSGEFLHKWSPTGGQRRLSNIGISYDGMGDTRGDYVGAFLIEDGCINSIVDRVFARNCWHGGIRISPQKLAGEGRDIVSLSATNIYLLDCGSAQDG